MRCLWGLLRMASWGWIAWAMVALGQSGGAIADSQAMPRSFEEALHGMSDAAAVIFAGQVISVRRVAGVGGASGVVEVTFRVERAVRGCADGGTYVLREWAGLWVGGDSRYRVGQRLMMLLRAQGANGISSPVGGMDGVIPIRGVESEIAGGSSVSGGGSLAVAAAPATGVDLRWVATRVLRGGASNSLVNAGGAAVQVRPESRALMSAGAAEGSGGIEVSIPSTAASLDSIVGMLTAWEAARVAH